MARRGRSQSENPTAQGNPTTLDVNEGPRVAQAIRLRRLGYTYTEIAARCGYKEESGARRAVTKANARIIRDEARALVGWQLDMLDSALQAVMTRIANDDQNSLWAVDRLVPLLKRQSELLGLDAKPDAQGTAPNITIVVPGAEAI
ncbi:MAG: hypothetical protein IVW57_11535 [Ktedonobacterales bacterium]|nr:hypothetical protein [Ktedonobacterales bacterium]